MTFLARDSQAVKQAVLVGMIHKRRVGEVMKEAENTLLAHPRASHDMRVAAGDCEQQNLSCQGEVTGKDVMGLGGCWEYCTLPFWLASQAHHRRSESNQPPRMSSCCRTAVPLMSLARVEAEC